MLLLSLLVMSMPAHAHATSTHIVAGPGSAQSTWTTPVLIAARGDVPLLVDTDLSFHGVESVSFGSDAASWCGPSGPGPESASNPRRYAIGACPLFWADTVPPQRGQTSVLGLDRTTAGTTYAFRCPIFPAMRGLLIVQ